jgi:hypothetical protein
MDSGGRCWRCDSSSGSGLLLSFSFLALDFLLLDDSIELVNVLLELLQLLTIRAG